MGKTEAQKVVIVGWELDDDALDRMLDLTLRCWERMIDNGKLLERFLRVAEKAKNLNRDLDTL